MVNAKKSEQVFSKYHRMEKPMNGWHSWKNGVILAILPMVFLFLGQAAQAQEYPYQPITMMIDRPPGAGTDVCSRVIAPGASKVLGQEIIPLNKAGAGG